MTSIHDLMLCSFVDLPVGSTARLLRRLRLPSFPLAVNYGSHRSALGQFGSNQIQVRSRALQLLVSTGDLSFSLSCPRFLEVSLLRLFIPSPVTLPGFRIRICSPSSLSFSFFFTIAHNLLSSLGEKSPRWRFGTHPLLSSLPRAHGTRNFSFTLRIGAPLILISTMNIQVPPRREWNRRGSDR